jgi:hypothetical protein
MYFGRHVWISTVMMRFAKAFDRNCTLEEFRISKVLRRTPRTVYELEGLRGKSIDGQFYAEITPVEFTNRTN